MSIGPWPQSNPPQVALTGSNLPNPPIPLTVTGPTTILASATYTSPGYAIPNYSQVSLVAAIIEVTTTATANWAGQIKGYDPADTAAWLTFNTAITRTTGTGIYRMNMAGVQVYGGEAIAFTVTNNDAANSITLNSGKVFLH